MTHQDRLLADISLFATQLWEYLFKHAYRVFFRFETVKDLVTGALYTKRGKYTRPFLHAAMMTLIFFGLTFGPKLVAHSSAVDPATASDQVGEVLGSMQGETGILTLESDKPWNQVSEYTVKSGDTLSSVAGKFNLTTDSIKWANDNVELKTLKVGLVLKIPPVDGIVYKVRPGDTVYTIAKKFETNAQGIVDFPLNTFSDDETFSLVAGQTLVVPDGVMPAAVAAPRLAQILTPDAGAVSATGTFVWPAYGRITQPFRWYHKGVDIANHDGGSILAADAGTVITAGWTNVGYGNYVVIDHGNGYHTLYGHMSAIAVVAGQRVARGAVIGQMGSTGRSTGTHLHFEIRLASGNVDPLGYLK